MFFTQPPFCGFVDYYAPLFSEKIGAEDHPRVRVMHGTVARDSS